MLGGRLVDRTAGPASGRERGGGERGGGMRGGGGCHGYPDTARAASLRLQELEVSNRGVHLLKGDCRS